MSGPTPLRNKTVEDLDLEKYRENNESANPYYRKFGSKKKSYFSVTKSEIFDSDDDDQLHNKRVDSHTSLPDEEKHHSHFHTNTLQ